MESPFLVVLVERTIYCIDLFIMSSQLNEFQNATVGMTVDVIGTYRAGRFLEPVVVCPCSLSESYIHWLVRDDDPVDSTSLTSYIYCYLIFTLYDDGYFYCSILMILRPLQRF